VKKIPPFQINIHMKKRKLNKMIIWFQKISTKYFSFVSKYRRRFTGFQTISVVFFLLGNSNDLNFINQYFQMLK